MEFGGEDGFVPGTEAEDAKCYAGMNVGLEQRT